MTRRTGVLLAVLAAVLGALLPTGTATAEPYCGITWGSATRTATATTSSHMVDLRAGRHDCYDRLVFDFDGSADGYWISYVDQVTEDATGDPIPLRGGARLQITVHAPAYDESWEPTYTYADRSELVDVSGYQTFRQVAWAGSWEGTTGVGLGVRARLPFRAFALPGRLVIDVAHHW